MKYNYREMVEEVAQDGLEYIINRYHVKDIFKEGFRDLLVTGKKLSLKTVNNKLELRDNINITTQDVEDCKYVCVLFYSSYKKHSELYCSPQIYFYNP